MVNIRFYLGVTDRQCICLLRLRGVALLKVGGLMAFSTCSLNPYENESVVAELLRRTRGAVELVDASSLLPELKRAQASNAR